MAAFEPVKALSNAAFESYKLASSRIRASSYSLPLPPSPPTSVDEANAEARLAWKDVRSRARWNHLAAGETPGEVAWIETAQRQVWIARFDEGTPRASKLFDIPPLATSDAATEQPTICSCGASRYALTDGQGTLHIITSAGEHLSAAHLALDGQPTPFRLHATEAGTALLSANVPRPGGAKTTALFDVVSVRLPAEGALDQGQLEVLGRWRGEDVPSYTRFDASGQHWLVGADSPYVPFPAPETTEAPVASTSTLPAPTKAPPPYRWTQSSDSVDIDIHSLPSTLKSSDFKISFSPSFVSMLSASLETPRFAHRQLWAPVDAGACTWTWEAVDGLLSLHLEKKDVGTRWTTLFAGAHDEGEVPETLSDVQLAEITASLDKYTSDGDIPHDFEMRAGLLGDEMDDEVDADEATADGSTVLTNLTAAPSTTERVNVISVALPTPGERADAVLVKRSYDGLLYQPEDDGQWKHITTYPALAFVLASKRNLRYRFHASTRYAIALESGGPVIGAGGASSCNAYVYWPPAPGVKAKHAVQAVASLSGSAVRGAAAVDADQVVVLCEGELAVLSGFDGTR